MGGCQCTRSSVCWGECHRARWAFNKISINCRAHLMTLAAKENAHSFRLGGWGLGVGGLLHYWGGTTQGEAQWWQLEVMQSTALSISRMGNVWLGYHLQLSKTNISKFQFNQESRRRRTTLWMFYLQIIIYHLYLVIFMWLRWTCKRHSRTCTPAG